MARKVHTCGYIWWTKHEIPGQPCVKDCPIERQICILEPDHEAARHKSSTGKTIKKES